MPYLRESQSPFLKSIFSRRDHEPLYVAIPSLAEAEEKPPLPVIVLTPSTPTDADGPPLVYPAGRLPQPNARLYFCDDGEEDSMLEQVSRWTRFSSRTARVAALLGLIGFIIFVHCVITRKLVPWEEEIATANGHH